MSATTLRRLIVLSLVVLWEVLPRTGLIPELFLPSLSSTLMAGWSEAERSKLRGVQACIWSEPMTDRAVFDRLVFPRLSAIAETGWTYAERKNYARFAGLAGLMPNLYGQREGAIPAG